MLGQLGQVGGYSDVNTLLADLMQTPLSIQRLLSTHVEVIQQQVRSGEERAFTIYCF